MLATLAPGDLQAIESVTESNLVVGQDWIARNDQVINTDAAAAEEEDPTYDVPPPVEVGDPPGGGGSDDLAGDLTGATPEQKKAIEEQAFWGARVLGPFAVDASPLLGIGASATDFGKKFGAANGNSPDAQEAGRHAYWEAWLLIKYGSADASEIGNIHETYGSSRDLYDSARDQWNNNIGRRIGQQVLDEGYWWSSTRDARVKELIDQAWDRGEFINKPNDPRITPDLMEQERLRQEQHRKDNDAALKAELEAQDHVIP